MKSKLITRYPTTEIENPFPCFYRSSKGSIALATSSRGGVILVVGEVSDTYVGEWYPDNHHETWEEAGWTPITDSKVTIEFRT